MIMSTDSDSILVSEANEEATLGCSLARQTQKRVWRARLTRLPFNLAWSQRKNGKRRSGHARLVVIRHQFLKR